MYVEIPSNDIVLRKWRLWLDSDRHKLQSKCLRELCYVQIKSVGRAVYSFNRIKDSFFALDLARS